jgi:alanine dehydrogenase
MHIGVPKEIKDREGRVALTPEGASALVAAGQRVIVEQGAGLGSGFPDAAYQAAGATLGDASAAWAAELVVKVKEPLAEEYGFLRGQWLFTYLHLAGVDRALTDALLRTRTTGLAYETLTDADDRLPLLAPMSAVAGNMAATMGAYYLARPHGGRGMQIGTVLGTRHGKVVVVGDGIVGRHAARTAHGMGGQVFVATHKLERAAGLQRECGAGVTVFLSTEAGIAAHLPDTDLLVGAVLLPGARAPKVVSEAMVATLPAGAVVVDVSIDQGGCIATARPTKHSDPVYTAHGVVHYCVTNMPGAYPRTSTLALTQATLPYILRLATGGLAAVAADPGFAGAVNTHAGLIRHRAVAEALDLLPSYAAFTP